MHERELVSVVFLVLSLNIACTHLGVAADPRRAGRAGARDARRGAPGRGPRRRRRREVYLRDLLLFLYIQPSYNYKAMAATWEAIGQPGG
jgi:hypothetical protein